MVDRAAQILKIAPCSPVTALAGIFPACCPIDLRQALTAPKCRQTGYPFLRLHWPCLPRHNFIEIDAQNIGYPDMIGITLFFEGGGAARGDVVGKEGFCGFNR